MPVMQFTCWWRKIVIIFASLRLFVKPSVCPCEKATDTGSFALSSNHNTSALTLCIFPTGKSLESANIALLTSLRSGHHSHNGLKIVLLFANESMMACSVVIRLSDIPIANAYNTRKLCPASCRPIPEVIIPNDLLFQQVYVNIFEAHGELPLTCSLTVEMIFHRKQRAENVKTSKRHDLNILLKEVFFRRIQECFEYVKIPKRLRHHHFGEKGTIHGDIEGEAFLPRKVKALVIWVGSASNLQLITDQAEVLSNQPNYGMDTVSAWAATDELYNCNENTTQCFGGNGRYKYLPHSAINVNKFGWRCAQRRPLRALAHVLQLFDPSLVVLLDDDTYLNYPLLVERFGSYLFNDMATKPIYMGEFIGKTGVHGHLSMEGIFAGGAGYILGHRVLQILNGRQTRFFGFEGVGTSALTSVDLSDGIRSDPQIRHLSLLAEAMTAQSGNQCQQSKGSGSCMPGLRTIHETHLVHKNESALFVPIGVRLIDLCVNLMANEHACHHRHSDSFIGCYFYST